MRYLFYYLLCVLSILFATDRASTILGTTATTKFVVASGGGGGTFTDNFTRANETPLAGNWTKVTGEVGTLNLSANAVAIGDINNDTAYYYTGTWLADQTSSVSVTAGGSAAGSGAGVCVRCSTTAQTYYRVVVDSGGNYEVGRSVAGSFTSIRTGTVTYSTAAQVKLGIVGSTLTFTYNGTQVGATMSDSNIATGKPGIAYSSTISGTTTMDDWTGTN